MLFFALKQFMSFQKLKSQRFSVYGVDRHSTHKETKAATTRHSLSVCQNVLRSPSEMIKLRSETVAHVT